MAEITKVALKVDNNNSFPNNNAGAITPAILRAFNTNMIDSMVDEIPFGAYTQSVNTSLNALNVFTASATGLTTGSLLITASAAGNVITFTKGNNSTFNVTVATGSIPDISNLNQATASLQSFTASAQISINNLNTTTASLNTSVSNINTFTASTAISITNLNASSASQQISIDSINQKTGSFATTGSNTFVSANTFTSISASSFVSASQFVGDGSKLTGLTSSISMPILDEGVPQGNAVSLNFTGSGVGASVVGGVAIISVYSVDSASYNSFTASMYQFTSSVNSTTASQQVSINNLNLYTSSFNTNTLVSTASFNSYTSSNNQRVSSLEVNSASVNTSISALNTYTASALVSISNINSTTASLNTSVTNINSATASLFTSASLALVTASFDTGTRNLTFTKGNTTQFSVNIPDVSGSAGTFVTTSSFNAYTQSNDQRVSSLETNSASVNISITNINSTTASLNTSVSNLNTATASLFTSTSLSLITASFNNGTRNLTFTKGDNQTFSVNIPDVSGSVGGFATLGANTFTGSQTISSSISVSGSATFVGGDVNFTDQGRNINIDVDGTIIKGQKAVLISQSLDIQNTLTASLATGFTYVGNATGRTTTVATSSFGTPIPSGTISGSAQITALGFVSSSVTASSLVTASVNLNTITFTKGDASTFALTVNTGSGGGGAAFPYAGTASISGSLQVTGSMSGLPITLSVTSNTASIDMTAGNQFVLTLPSSSTTHIAASSIKAGQTINLLIKQQVGPATGSITFAPTIFFPSGVDMQATATGSAIDLVSMISFDTTNLMAANVKNLK